MAIRATEIQTKIVNGLRVLKFSVLPKWLLITLVVLIGLRLALPHVLLWGTNKALATKLGIYTGHVDDLDLSLHRGAYQVQGITIKKKDSDSPPLIQVAEIDLSLAWRALLRKELTGDITIQKLVVKLADSADSRKRQYGTEDKSWQEMVSVLLPISIESLSIHDSAFYFINNDLKEPLSLAIEKIQIQVLDLHNKGKTLSHFDISALVQDHAKMSANGQLDMLSKPPRADVDFSLVGFKSNTINKMMRAYIPLDVTEGEIGIFSEIAVGEGDAVGYTKVFLKDADIVAPTQEFKSGKHFLFEVFAAFTNWVLKNSDTKKVGIFIPFQYRKGKLDINTGEAFWSTVQNKFDEMKPGLENSVNLASIKKGEIKKVE